MTEEQTSLDQWQQLDQPEQAVTLEQMDQLLVDLRQKRDHYDELKAKATEAHGIYEAQMKLVIDTLNANKRNSYSVDGVGSVHIVHKEVYTTPKTNEQKTSLFNFIKENYGPDVLMSMVSINSQTLNSWANKEAEAGVMSIPGLEAPTMQENLSLRRR